MDSVAYLNAWPSNFCRCGSVDVDDDDDDDSVPFAGSDDSEVLVRELC